MKHTLNKSVIVFSIIFLSIAAHAQDDRQNASLPVIGSKVLWSLSEATGWIKNNEGQWLEGKNVIYERHLSAVDKSSFNEGKNILGKDNFIKYELRDITIGGIDFLLLTKGIIESGYDYPSTKGGWKPLKGVYYLVFKKGKAKVKQHDYEPKAVSYTAECYFRGLVDLKEGYLEKIALNIAESDRENPDFKKAGITVDFRLDYKLLTDGKMCRFHLFADARDWDMQPEGHVGFIHDHANRLQDYYFECPKEKLDELLKYLSK